MSAWADARLGDLCEVTTGGTPPRSRADFFGGPIPWVKIGDMLQGRIISTEETISRSALQGSSAKLLPPGTVLISIFATIGRTAVLDVEAATNQAIAGVTPRNRSTLTPRYLRQYLDHVAIALGEQARGVAQVNINSAILKSLTIPLPPLSEQLRIAEVLDRAEGLRAKRRLALDHLDKLTQSIFLDMFGNPVSNPRGWVVATLGDVATFVGGGTPSRAVPEYFSGSLCWATSKDMKGRFLDDTEEHVTELAVQKSATKLVSPGTILVVVKSKVLMHRLPVAVARVQTCFGQDLKGIILDDRCTVSYVATALRTCQGWLLDRARGINTEGLSLDHLQRFPLLLPPLSLQKDFERRAEQVEALRQSLGHSLSQLDALFSSLQHRAFRGEL
jgi:type I restriction enzyme, S subunit